MKNTDLTIYKILKNYLKTDKNILNSNFIKNKLIDSLDMIKLIFDIEKKFQISFKRNDLNERNFCSKKNINKIVKKYLEK
tara:strand:+ start:51 stop:290 length:240 start_codon:yes stop_codon:yes gene_type:complete